MIGFGESGRDVMPRFCEETDSGTQVWTKCPELVRAVGFPSTQDAGVVNLIARLPLQTRQTTVRNGLVERLQVFERGVGFVLGRCAQVFVQSLVCGLPGVGLFLAQALGEVLA